MKYLKEAAAFEKLILPLETSQQTESLVVEENISLEVPDNNPFKIGKAKEVSSDLRMNVTEDASVLTYVEKSDISTMRNEQSTEEEQNVILLDQEKEDANVQDCKCLVTSSLESRESLSSRPKRAATNSKQIKGGDKQKRRKIKSSESTSNSILNYFFLR